MYVILWIILKKNKNECFYENCIYTRSHLYILYIKLSLYILISIWFNFKQRLCGVYCAFIFGRTYILEYIYLYHFKFFLNSNSYQKQIKIFSLVSEQTTKKKKQKLKYSSKIIEIYKIDNDRFLTVHHIELNVIENVWRAHFYSIYTYMWTIQFIILKM